MFYFDNNHHIYYHNMNDRIDLLIHLELFALDCSIIQLVVYLK